MASSSEARCFAFEGFQLDAAKRKLIGPDGPVEIPSRAFDVLIYLVAHAGELLDKATILKAVWPSSVVEEGNLSRCIFELRRALGDTAGEPRFVATVPGRGYQFVARVRESSATVSPPEAAPPRSRGPLYVGAAVRHAVAFLLALRFWPGTPAPPAKSVPAPMPASIVVLPFDDLSSTQDMEYFAEGLAEELRNSLSKVGGL